MDYGGYIKNDCTLTIDAICICNQYIKPETNA